MAEQQAEVAWIDLGAADSLMVPVGGPLGKGAIDANDFVVCPWHHYKFHRCTGAGEPGFEDDRVPHHALKIENGRLLLNPKPVTSRNKLPHPPHPLARKPQREPGPTRVVAISTTAMDERYPRYSTSEALLDVALESARTQLGAQTRLIRLNALKFRHCEGYYSKAAKACTWPCSITEMDRHDQMEQVYEALVHWADVVLIGTPIRWGAASSLYHKMVERMNCIQNQITLRNEVLIRNKVAAFIITGGQDNVQAVAGQMLMFFSEIGFVFPPFPFIAHTLGWECENMERNTEFVQRSEALRDGARQLVANAVRLAQDLIERDASQAHIERGGRKAHNAAAAATTSGAE